MCTGFVGIFQSLKSTIEDYPQRHVAPIYIKTMRFVSIMDECVYVTS